MAERATAKPKTSSPSRGAKPVEKRAARAKASAGSAKGTGTSKGTAASKTPGKSKGASDLAAAIERLEAQVMDLKAERDDLKAELSSSVARVKELEKVQVQAINRIDWVIDSLHNVMETK
ncbi:MAG: hypothetical protein AAFV45_01520 [Pseudomonadota bacterium]